MTRSAMLVGLLLLAVPALAQQEIPWRTDARQAVREAQAAKRPLMVYCRGSVKDIDDEIKHGHRRSLMDPRVLRAASRFVPLRLSRSADREILGEFGLPVTANMMMSFVSHKGEVLGTLGALGVAQPESLVTKLNLVFEEHAKKLYLSEIRPVLLNAEAAPKDLRDAIDLVRQFGITDADKDLIDLLGGDRLNADVRRSAYQTLAVLSTKPGIEKLLELSWQGDADAANACGLATPEGAELMLGDLTKFPDNAFPYSLYTAIAKACDIRKTRPERWFQNADEKLRTEEIETFSTQVREAAQRWRSEYGRTR